jgi:type II secretory pathway pseudopilin PulG
MTTARTTRRRGTTARATRRRGPAAARRAGRERGYALVALLALMTVLMVVMMAAAPGLQQQSRRERELEAIARGEEVAEAVRMYIHYRKQPPTSMEELLDGVTPQGSTKKIYVLRASAARDPLSKSGEWRIVKFNDSALATFVKDLAEYADGHLPEPTTDPELRAFAVQIPRPMAILNLGEGERASGGEDESGSSNGPFIGVASRSQRDSIVTYYGIERHDHWVFTPFFK